ncbi:hypothetical protein HPT29_018250 [Microvirga terrae]|uniref:Class I SAM-dependent methyltransferase n=1 Tax=Microvirga terrae TaxID=2740529 RepID=A0ABY5RRM1_9HYPH|nr:hypothetical protein [Microvirga terrae]UVF18427.1 hypothetical protein HPT29_018250 [Microvirga terrae]
MMRYWIPPSETLEHLWSERFPALPRYCGNDSQPGIDEVEEWRDWTMLDTTPDQLRIEGFLERHDLSQATLLHVGVGNSGLAKRFAQRTKEIVGTTISNSEMCHGRKLNILNYHVYINNKYSGEPVPGPEEFDFIIDNNPTTFACCRDHLCKMMVQYRSRLKENGMIVTDREGLGWVVSAPSANPRWGFSFDDWAALGEVFRLKPKRIDNDIYVLAGESAVIRHNFRPPSIKHAVRKISRLFRR